MSAIGLFALVQFMGFEPTSGAILIAYSKGLISFKSASLGLGTLFGNSGLAAAMLSKITVGDVLGDMAAESIADSTILAWLGPWGLVILAGVIIATV